MSDKICTIVLDSLENVTATVERLVEVKALNDTFSVSLGVDDDNNYYMFGHVRFFDRCVGCCIGDTVQEVVDHINRLKTHLCGTNVAASFESVGPTCTVNLQLSTNYGQDDVYFFGHRTVPSTPTFDGRRFRVAKIENFINFLDNAGNELKKLPMSVVQKTVGTSTDYDYAMGIL